MNGDAANGEEKGNADHDYVFYDGICNIICCLRCLEAPTLPPPVCGATTDSDSNNRKENNRKENNRKERDSLYPM